MHFSERLSVRLVIVQVWWALVGSLCEGVLVCVYICVSVHNGFMVEVYKFYVSLHTPLPCVHSLWQK